MLASDTMPSESEHAKELGNAVPQSPFFFLKPTSSYLENGGAIEIPRGCEVHHESEYLSNHLFFFLDVGLTWTLVELAVIIGKNGRDIPATEADEYVGGKFRLQMHIYLPLLNRIF